jgi:hypothetical protein
MELDEMECVTFEDGSITALPFLCPHGRFDRRHIADEHLAADRLSGLYMSANGFRVLGNKPVLGRDFRADDDKPGAPPVAILANGVWQSRYGGDPSIIGRTIRLNDVPTTIVGVMAPGNRFPMNTDVSLQGLLIEESDRTQGDGGRRASDLFLVRQVQEVLTKIFFGELVRAGVVMRGQLAHGRYVAFLGSCREPPQLHILQHPLT